MSRLDWNRDGRDWPHRGASRFVAAGGAHFHVQVMGAGPPVLLLHGMGAASHSWRGLAPLLADRFTVVAPDLPGHAFTPMPLDGMSLPGMARAVAALLAALGMRPELVVGHSAGAAIAVRMALDGMIAPQAVVSLNGALLPMHGLAGQLFSPAARLLARLPLVPELFTSLAGDQSSVARLLRDTGSIIDAEGLRLYARLVRNPGHVAGALAMMAHWDLPALARDLPLLAAKLVLVAAGNDRTVPPATAARVRAMLPAASVVTLPGLGHLAHEERPDLVADLATALLAPEPAEAAS